MVKTQARINIGGDSLRVVVKQRNSTNYPYRVYLFRPRRYLYDKELYSPISKKGNIEHTLRQMVEQETQSEDAMQQELDEAISSLSEEFDSFSRQ
jgi:hypothetical protein